MDISKFERSCLRFRDSMDNENSKRRKVIELEQPIEKVKIKSVEINFPKLEIQDLIASTRPKTDILAKLVKDLGIDQDVDFDLRGSTLKGVLSSIGPINPGSRTRFKLYTQIGTVLVYIRCSLNVWIIMGQEKLIFPKPRSDINIESSVP